MRRGELQPRLDDPDWICRGARGDTRDCGSTEVYVGVFLSVVELVGDDLFSVTVREEVYGAGRDDADESGSETFEQRTGRFVSCNISRGAFEHK